MPPHGKLLKAGPKRPCSEATDVVEPEFSASLRDCSGANRKEAYTQEYLTSKTHSSDHLAPSTIERSRGVARSNSSICFSERSIPEQPIQARARPSVHQPARQELTMSGINGDKSRFNRQRKQKIARRKRTRELLKIMRVPRKPAPTSSEANSQAVPA